MGVGVGMGGGLSCVLESRMVAAAGGCGLRGYLGGLTVTPSDVRPVEKGNMDTSMLPPV